jgi:hypothetical protein
MRKPTFLFFVLSVTLMSCLTVAEPTQAKKWITISEGGGFTGHYITYYILKNGQVFRIETKDTAYQELHRIAHNKTRALFKGADTLFRVPSKPLNPDNIMKTIGYHRKDTTLFLSWSHFGGAYEMADEFYTTVQQTILDFNRDKISPQ